MSSLALHCFLSVAFCTDRSFVSSGPFDDSRLLGHHDLKPDDQGIYKAVADLKRQRLNERPPRQREGGDSYRWELPGKLPWGNSSTVILRREGLLHSVSEETREHGLPFPVMKGEDSFLIKRVSRDITEELYHLFGVEPEVISNYNSYVRKRMRLMVANWADDPVVIAARRYLDSGFVDNPSFSAQKLPTERPSDGKLGYVRSGPYAIDIDALPWSIGTRFHHLGTKSERNLEAEEIQRKATLKELVSMGLTPLSNLIDALADGINASRNGTEERILRIQSGTVMESVHRLFDSLAIGEYGGQFDIDDVTFTSADAVTEMANDPFVQMFRHEDASQPLTQLHFEMENKTQPSETYSTLSLADPYTTLFKDIKDGTVPLAAVEHLHPLIHCRSASPFLKNPITVLCNDNQALLATLHRPSLLTVPDYYENIYSLYLMNSLPRAATGMAHIPKSSYICLLCGTHICASDCCKTESPGGRTTVPVSKGTSAVLRVRQHLEGQSVEHNVSSCPPERHSLACGGGVCLYLDLESTEVIVYMAAKNPGIVSHAKASWGSIYVDRNGEEDPYLTRGRLLRVSRNRKCDLVKKVLLGSSQSYRDTLIDTNGVSRSWTVLAARNANMGVQRGLANIITRLIDQARRTDEGAPVNDVQLRTDLMTMLQGAGAAGAAAQLRDEETIDEEDVD